MTYFLRKFNPQKAILLIAWLLSSLSMIGQVNFSSSGLSGEVSNNPTSLQFGPDGRLYVSQQNGTIYAYTVQRNGPNDYEVTSTENISLVKGIQNHNDNGTTSGNNNRQVTGILVTGTGLNPILYVSSSDPRIGAGGGGNDTGLDTNSGVISKLTCTGGIDGSGQCAGWTKVDIIRGLPRSEENHATNGLQLDEQNNILYIAQGGHTNAGAPSNNFAFTTEYALSAAILEADLDVIEALPTQTDSEGASYKYNLPTLQNVSKADLLANDNDHPDPWGGDDGLNQAMLDPNGPVQIYSPGWRNIYDIVLTESGRMYGVDNGANGGWGGHPEYEESYDATNNYVSGEPGSTGPGVNPATYPSSVTLLDGLNGTVASDGQADPQVNNKNGLHLISQGYYAGHPAPIRGNPDGAGLYYNGTFYATGNPNLPASWPPVTAANPVECDFQQSGVDDGAMANYGPSTNGIAEYTASNFQGALQGALLLAAYNGNIYQVFLNAAGDEATNCPSNPVNNCSDSFASGFGSNPLDVIAQGDNDPFGGTVWAVTYGADNITIFEPSDYDGNDPGQCLGTDDDTIDEDNDGYTNADEIDNGTNPCSGASKPADFDDVVEFNGFKRSDLNDSDDDNDGIPDVDDAFCFDAQNGKGGIADLPIRLDLFNSTGYGFGSLGFTGIMTNGLQDYFGLIDDSGDELVFGGTAGIYTDPTVTAGDAFEGTNTQKNAFQFPINVSTATGPFTVSGQINGPFFNNQSPQDFASHGIFIGAGDQNNYLKVTIRNNGGNSAFQILYENGGSSSDQIVNVSGIFNATAIIIYLSVDPANGEVQASYSADGGTRTNIGNPVTVTGSLLSAIQGTYSINGQASALAAGPMATSNGPAPEFAASWDYFEVTQNPSDAQAQVEVNTGGIDGSTFGNASFSIENISAGSNITKVTFDLTDAIIPEVVFDPNGTAGDATSKDLTFNNGSDGGTGYVNHNFGKAYEGGFYSLEVNFNDFAPGETVEFGLDIDPVSIKGGSSPGPNEAGSVSGLELSGATVVVTFDTGEAWTVELFSDENDSDGDGKNKARNALPDAPTIALDNNITTQSVVVTPNHILTVTGPVNGEVVLMQLEAGLFLDGLDGPNAPGGYDIDPWEVNSVIGVTKLTGTISNSFTAEFNVTLADSDDEAGYNIFAAVIVDEDGATSDLSNIIIVEYDPDAAPAEEIRINAGGPAYTDSNNKVWAADNYFVNGTDFGNATAIANTDDDVLYQTERYAATLEYEIPVAGTGPYEVNLLFAELYFGLPGGGSSGGVGSRLFDIVVEGEVKQLNFDIFAEAGGAAALTKSYSNITVTDGFLSLSFEASANNGKVSAIEVLGFGDPGDIPITLTPISDQVDFEGQQATVDIAAVGGDGNLLYSASGLPTGLSVEPTNGDIIGTIAVGAAAGGPNNDGVYTVTVTVDDSDGDVNDVVSTQFTWTILEPSETVALYRVNAGGPQLAAADASTPVWTADTGNFGTAGNSPYLANMSTGGSTYNGNAGSAHGGPIITTDPSLALFPEIPSAVFNTERYDALADPAMLWQFDVAAGTEVEIALLFAELFGDITAAGQRVFDVSIDGVVPPAFNDLDPYAIAGPKGAFVRTFTTISDGTIDIEFLHGVENPAIKGIQISTVAATDNDPPVVTNPGTQSGVEGDAVTLQIAATDDEDCGDLTYSATGLPPSLSINPSTGVISGTLDEGSGSGVAGAFIENNGVLIIEAETDFVDAPGGWEPLTEGGTDFLLATSNNFGDATAGQVLTYDIQINTPGVYRFHMKSDITGNVGSEENDSWFKIDNTSDVHFFCSQGGTVSSTQAFLNEIADPSSTSQTYYYPAGNAVGRSNFSGSNPGNKGYFKVFRSGTGDNKWDSKTIDNNSFPIYAYFPTAGGYTINMSERSSGHKVDRFALIHVDEVNGGDGIPINTLNGPESQQATGGTAGAADGSPYNVTVTVTDACDPPAGSSVNFAWLVSETPPTGDPSALIEITPDGALEASTFGASSIQLTNTSTGNLQITSVSLDLSTGILPDMVFDPVGIGGDAVASCFTANSGATATGLIAPADPCTTPFSAPRNGGFDEMSISFTDFDPNEQFFYTVDVDPNSIQGVPGAGGAGSVSGYELIGATVTITFSDGSTLVSNIYEDGSLGGGQAVVAENAPATPTITAIGQEDVTCVESANQTIEVSGTPGANVSLLLMDSRLFIQSGNPPFNVPDETFYANEAMSGKTLYTAVIGNDGTVEIPVVLLETPGPGGTTNGGLNHIVAVLSDGPYAVDQQVSQTSNVLILKLDPTCAGAGADLTLTVSNQGRDLGQATPDYSGEYSVNLFSLTDAETPVASFTPTANAAGEMTISDITPGTYQVAVKRAGFLQRVQTITLTEGANSATIAELLAGDVDGNNVVELEDFSLLGGVFNTANINPGGAPNYGDFNGDGSIGLEDFSASSGNFNVAGEEPVQQP